MKAMTREGEDIDLPFALYGPKVMLINELAGSGGDALPWMFRRLGIGPLVGTRTWGGLIGIGGYPSLIDGGFVTAPRWALYSPDGSVRRREQGRGPRPRGRARRGGSNDRRPGPLGNARPPRPAAWRGWRASRRRCTRRPRPSPSGAPANRPARGADRGCESSARHRFRTNRRCVAAGGESRRATNRERPRWRPGPACAVLDPHAPAATRHVAGPTARGRHRN